LRLLFDQNLSRALVLRLADLFPGSTHVTNAGLETASDIAIWAWAAEHDRVLVTKDRDFERDVEYPGPPPKCVLLMLGNATTDDVELRVRQAVEELAGFEHDARRVLVLA
jgi:predicted nuclease of predicted toxin-antitoxin system